MLMSKTNTVGNRLCGLRVPLHRELSTRTEAGTSDASTKSQSDGGAKAVDFEMTRQRQSSAPAQSPRDRRRSATAGTITYGNRQDSAPSQRGSPRDSASTSTTEGQQQGGQWAASPSWPAVAPSKGGPTSRRDKNGRSSTAYDDEIARPSAESLSAAAAAFASARAETSSRSSPQSPPRASAAPKGTTYSNKSTESGSSGSFSSAERVRASAPSASRSSAAAVLDKPVSPATAAADAAAELRFAIEDKKLLPVFDSERDEDEYPTYVPRNPGIKDGDWNERDLKVVALAQRQASQAVIAKTVDFSGDLGCWSYSTNCILQTM